MFLVKILMLLILIYSIHLFMLNANSVILMEYYSKVVTIDLYKNINKSFLKLRRTPTNVCLYKLANSACKYCSYELQSVGTTAVSVAVSVADQFVIYNFYLQIKKRWMQRHSPDKR